MFYICQSVWREADRRYERALRQQPHYEALAHPAIQAVGWGLVALGQTLVVTSIYALGITGKLFYR
jgi:phosphatidylethanolamine N-methyltransferase